MRVPDFGVLRHDRTYVTLYSLAEERPVALVFLRHLGCVFCREQVGTLRDDLPDANIVFVTMSEPKLADRFRTWLRSPHVFLCDPERRIYEAFGVKRSTAGGFFTQTVVKRALRAYRRGYRNALTFDDQLQLGGTYVFDKDGEVLYSHDANDISDYPPSESLRTALAALPEPVHDAIASA